MNKQPDGLGIRFFTAAQVAKARADGWKCDCCGMAPVAVDTDNQMLLCTICAGRLVDAAQIIECAGEPTP